MPALVARGPVPLRAVAEHGDAARCRADVRFGMRTFRFDPGSRAGDAQRQALLPARHERHASTASSRTPARGDLPWRADWVRRLHQQFKRMHWNSIRYCIGFPPEFWYDIADEEGFLIQDEFPIWLLAAKPAARESRRPRRSSREYTEWMRERWNHPCVVIWDAQNESLTDETGKAIQAVRHLDLSQPSLGERLGRAASARRDCVESHPYLVHRGTGTGQKPFHLSGIGQGSPACRSLTRRQQRSVPCRSSSTSTDWLWLNRDGRPTCLTDKVYESLLGPNSTAEQRRMLHARYLAAQTEFWRCHRECAGVLHFCGLGYSRPGDKPRPGRGRDQRSTGSTSKQLIFEPHFEQYVRDAFNPVGLMLDFWAEELPAGAERPFKVVVINDLEREWRGDVRLRVLQGETCLSTRTVSSRVPGYGRATLTIPQRMPMAPGEYTLVAELTGDSHQPIRSVRNFKVPRETPRP